MRSFKRLAAFAALVLLAAGCGSDSPTTPVTNASLAGVYTLRTVNGGALPAVIQAASSTDPKIEILRDELTVKVDGSWSGVEDFRVTTGPTVETQTVNSSGTYAVSGSLVSFTDTLGDVLIATVSGNSFTLGDGSYVYAK
jgi:hypothetical protein